MALVAGERFELGAEVALWLSACGLGGARVLAVVPNDVLDQYSPTGVRELHRTLEHHAQHRQRPGAGIEAGPGHGTEGWRSRDANPTVPDPAGR